MCSRLCVHRPEVDLLVSLQPAQPESVHATTFSDAFGTGLTGCCGGLDIFVPN